MPRLVLNLRMRLRLIRTRRNTSSKRGSDSPRVEAVLDVGVLAVDKVKVMVEDAVAVIRDRVGVVLTIIVVYDG